ncbi:MAG: sigma-70 family RNA polymerase sigma factor [Kiritimatiellae bacterium]|nr:sigma-70 family RNA polymerase sigma factor [Kiritimatiellia bacterium]
MECESNTGAVFEMELANAQLTLLTYIAKLLGGVSDARDVLQETNLALCKARERYDPARPFMAWARTVAYYEVMTWRKRQSRSRVIFSDETVERLAASMAHEEMRVDDRLTWLEACKKLLPAGMATLLDLYYGENESLAEIASRTGRSAHSLANSLYYVRKVLKDCVEGHMAQARKAGHS